MIDQDGHKVYIYHSKPGQLKDGHRATVALKEVGEDAYQVGVAVCSKTDQFVKKVGVQKAAGRARSNDKQNSHVAVSPKRDEIVKAVFSEVDSCIKKGTIDIDQIESVSMAFRSEGVGA